MKIKIILTIFLILADVTISHSSEIITMKGTGMTPDGSPFMLRGKLTKPQGDGPFPAIVCLHGCGGISRRDDTWAERLSSWGYVALQVDSFGPRDQSNICTHSRLIPPEVRAQDAHDAKAFLSDLPFIDEERIAVMGWSHGGWTTLYTVSHEISIRNRTTPFKAAVAFYPYCDLSLSGLDAPLLILIGSYDDWTPAEKCSRRMPSRKTSPEVILKVYPKAYHSFDAEGMDRYARGARGSHRMLYHPQAAADATVRVRDFLDKHLK